MNLETGHQPKISGDGVLTVVEDPELKSIQYILLGATLVIGSSASEQEGKQNAEA